MTAQRKTMMVLCGCFFLAWCSICMAQVPHRINYQGFLTDGAGTTALDGAYDITFSIYTGAGAMLWQETHSAVAVDRGVFNVHLGQDPTGNPFPAFDGEMYLGIQVDSDSEMIPRQLLTSVPFAFKSGNAETLDGNPASEFSAADHAHDFSELTGTASDTQIPDTITINNAAHARNADHASSADHAAKSDKADWAATAEKADQATEAGYADDAGHALTAKSALTADNAANADTVDGLHAGAFSPAGHGHFFLNASDGSPAKALYVDDSGNVGIGTSSPLRSLDVSGTARFMVSDGTVGMNEFEYDFFPVPYTRSYGINAQMTADTNYTYGVKGSAENGTAGNFGVYGTTSAENGTGSYGIARNTGDVTTHGGYFRSFSQKGIGVKGEATYSGENYAQSYGGYFTSSSRLGIGVFAKVDYSSAGLKYAGYFECDSDVGYGVYATVNGSSSSNWAFRGVASGTGSNGAWFSTEGESTTAVYANATGQYGIGLHAVGGAYGLAASFRGNVKIQRQSDGVTVMELGEGLDFAEGFHVEKPDMIEPGTVLVIDSDTPGRLRMSQTPYDTKVAGIVAGANGLGSGVRLGAGQFDHDVALAGRVYCMVDATEERIQPGDLLTTSSAPGHAMKASDRNRSYGTILGKAMESMEKGRKGKLLVLVTLQ